MKKLTRSVVWLDEKEVEVFYLHHSPLGPIRDGPGGRPISPEEPEWFEIFLVKGLDVENPEEYVQTERYNDFLKEIGVDDE
jgi:hypothetical protein